MSYSTLLQEIEQLSLTSSSNELQLLAAKKLREAAINHLASSQGIMARSFRGEYLASQLGDYKAFLQTQAQNNVWATYIEACALGEMFDHNVLVTLYNDGKKQSTICLYRSERSNAPTITLCNSDNTHWYFDQNTLGDGNCLYNAFLQALAEKTTLKPYSSIFKNVMDQQRQILNDARTPSQLAIDFEKEQRRIQSLPAEIQDQIAKDYQYALKMAAEVLSRNGKVDMLQIHQNIPQTEIQLAQRPMGHVS